MKHACVAGKTGREREAGRSRIARHIRKARDNAIGRFCRYPKGWPRIFAHGSVARLAKVTYLGCAELLVLSKNRDSASRVSLC